MPINDLLSTARDQTSISCAVIRQSLLTSLVKKSDEAIEPVGAIEADIDQ